MSEIKFDVFEELNELPEAVQKTIVGSLAGTMNSSLVWEAQSVLNALRGAKISPEEVVQLDIVELENMFRPIDNEDASSAFDRAKAMNALAQAWQSMTVMLNEQKETRREYTVRRDGSVKNVETAPFGTLQNTLNWRAENKGKPWRQVIAITLEEHGVDTERLTIDEIEAQLTARGEDIPRIKAAYLQDIERQRDLASREMGAIEWIIEHAFAPSEDPDFSKLDGDLQRKLMTKMFDRLLEGRQQSIVGARRDWTSGDRFIAMSTANKIRPYL